MQAMTTAVAANLRREHAPFVANSGKRDGLVAVEDEMQVRALIGVGTVRSFFARDDAIDQRFACSRIGQRVQRVDHLLAGRHILIGCHNPVRLASLQVDVDLPDMTIE